MQQRRLRLGDILDDYCPRERRITNHAVVAMIEDEVRQTRCTTCDTEHEFKQGKLPTLRKKKESVSAAYKEVLAGVVKDNSAVPGTAPPEQPPPAPGAVAGPTPPAEASAAPGAATPAPQEEPVEERAIAANEDADGLEGLEGEEAEAARVHRRLIRATLPRPENHQVVRPVPEFTMRQPTGRGGKFRPGGARTQRPGAGRNGNLGASGRGGFTRTTPGRGGQPGRAAGRADAHRPRGGQPPRPGKKHSK